MKLLKHGSKGEDVRRLQQLLVLEGYNISVDGHFGKNTKKAVEQYQAAQGLMVDGIVGKGTWGALLSEDGEWVPVPAALQYSGSGLPPVLERAKSLGYQICEADYELNLVGIRSRELQANSFDDYLVCCWKVAGKWTQKVWPITTDPGTFWMLNFNEDRVSGTAVLVPGQYFAHKLDLHSGSYEAICQRLAKVRVYRDANRDNTLNTDDSTISEGYFGINIHRSSKRGESTKVEKWSAGCQVHARLACFEEMMTLARQQVAKTKKELFPYTLLRQWF
jgi:hypothetical protein